ncbi:putative ankyrin repeat-containing domain-containing protein [Helianthus annuus]|nr:putative ankyrin repeat-containing domain-containing protein [Helianthus annuus]
MCKVTKGKFYSVMDEEKLAEKYQGLFLKCLKLLELAAADDVTGFVHMVEDNSVCIDEVSFWYGRRIRDLRKMGLEERTPLMIASTYGSIRVLKYIIEAKRVDVNKFSDSDGATALHCAVARGSPMSVAVADVNMTDGNVNKAIDLIAFKVKPCSRAYTHDWTECPFVHPGENAHRRDLRKFNYSCVPFVQTTTTAARLSALFRFGGDGGGCRRVIVGGG